MADIMEILGDDRFRINTYRKVSRIVSEIPADVAVLLESDKLAEVPGIGKSSLAKIQEYVETGRITAYEQLLEKIPASLLDLLRIPTMGPKSARAVYEKLNVTSAEQLKEAILAGKVTELPGFGDKKAEQMLKGIEFLAAAVGRIRVDQALDAAETVTEFFSELDGVGQVKVAGSLRRFKETIGDVDVLVTCKGPAAGEQIVAAFTAAPFVEEVFASGPAKGSARIATESGPVQVDVRVVAAESFGAAAQYFTGSQAHNVRLREIAVKAGLKLNEYGLFEGEKMIAGAGEGEIYSKLGLDFVDPRLREDRGEVQAAMEHRLPGPAEISDIRGDFHAHTRASDGDAEIEEVVEAAIAIGYEFIAITDHSQSSAIANGLSAKRLAKQIEEIAAISERYREITIFAGSEVDILADGSLDFENELLSELDIVIASVHSVLGGAREKCTTRTLRAMDNPYVNIIGHPTGRLINQREPMDIDIERIIEHAAETGTAMEINANPYRLDLKDTHCRLAVDEGVKLAIGTDAHSTGSLGLMPFGLSTAARGWAQKADILNTGSAEQIRAFVAAKRS